MGFIIKHIKIEQFIAGFCVSDKSSTDIRNFIFTCLCRREESVYIIQFYQQNSWINRSISIIIISLLNRRFTYKIILER